METKAKMQLHIAMFPWLAYGHIMPFFEVSKFLAQKGHRISYISTPKNINSLLNKVPSHLSSLLSFVQLPLPHVHGLPPGAESTADLPIHKVPYLKKAFDKLEAPLTDFLTKTSDVNWIICDFAPHWLPQLGINLVYFSIYNATSIAFFGPPSELVGVRRQRPENFTVVPDWIDYPSDVAFKLHEMVTHEQCMDSDASDFLRLQSVLQGCQFVTVRSCPEFEPDPFILLPKLYQKPVVPLGLLPPTVPSNEDKGDDEKWEALKEWLDTQNEKSVFYAALGTEVALSQQQMHELALGIEESGLPFLWVVKNRPLVEAEASGNVLPPGFEKRISGRGIILRDWAPQLRILAHPSVGGFLTHCGWSSVIESLGAGKPLILFPGASSDLGLVARLMHSRKVGFEIQRNDVDGSFTGESVGRAIKLVMEEAEGEPIRANAWAMKETFGNVELSRKHLNELARLLEEFPPSSGSEALTN